MKFMRIGAPGAEEAVVEIDGRVYAVGAALNGAFLAEGGVERVAAAASAGELPEVSIDDARVGAPLERPGKIVCIGLNYRDHADETGAAYPDEPVVFMKDPSTVVGPYDEVLVPRRSTKTDWEVELGVVIGRTARYLDAPADAAAHIAGYVLSHDVSEREFQLERGGQWDKGKSCETFNPLGPWFVPAAEVGDPGSLRLRLWVNGTLMQDGTTANMIFGIDHVVWYLSQFMVLNPGDVINTGTPAGVALGHADPKPYLKEGDVVELEIDGLGRARQVMVQA
ncbi:fumarylacetoacetate hydrolase family protein [Microbacterium sp. SSW1-59]|uniref:fumarylacetoacetate hydrolase family protein n=1 Tax=Microbacterium xanthum TaxID=3079794 RepID=UPI002AD5B370|nr:fumarylacetoacetate hydrolase family protein [Microbacterium sp. SSW1-59]MDZ8200355.1 fumarylacetoacetate hydrolase family protein [Microbacterium sp. SSW1-59]